jgi:hypothetical protein
MLLQKIRGTLVSSICTGFLVGCLATKPLKTSDLSTAAEAELTVREGQNDNTLATLQVDHLAEPQKLRGDLEVYSVWIRPSDDQQWKNVGQMKVGDSRSGKFDIVTPYKNFDVLVTAETHGTAEEPSNFVVLNGESIRRK